MRPLTSFLLHHIIPPPATLRPTATLQNSATQPLLPPPPQCFPLTAPLLLFIAVVGYLQPAFLRPLPADFRPSIDVSPLPLRVISLA